MRPQEGKDELVDVKNFLVAKAAETPSGMKVDPASPLKADRGRPIPAGAALSQQPTTAGTLSPGSDQWRGRGRPAPRRAPRAPPRRLRRVPRTPSVTTAPAAPELTGEAGGGPPTVPVTATPEGDPDTTTTTTNNGMGSGRTSSGGGSSEESAPPTTS